MLIAFGKKPLGLDNLPAHLNQILKANCVIGEHDQFGKVVILKSPNRFIKDWIETTTDKSQVVSMSLKAGIIAEMCDESEDFGKTLRVPLLILAEQLCG